ncbi:MAG: LysE family translocator [Gammaproteobacteria bacterium]|jgi:threonine/homoserine/homoserine lactone efflux protein|nr:LysE family translocator [Gammaproteobacteria bacterium]
MQELALFVLGSVVVAASPGPAVLYIVARTLDQGTLAGLVSMAGISSGALVHVLLAAVGVAAAMQAWPASLLLVQVAGAGYLLWLGIQRLRTDSRDGTPVARQPLAQIYRQGVVVNLTNPKTILFLLAFLPQFVRSDGGPVWRQMLGLGVAFVLIASTSDGLYALAAGRLRGWLRGSEPPRWPSYLAAAVYLGLGAVGLWDALGR